MIRLAASLNVIAAIINAYVLGTALGENNAPGAAFATACVAINFYCWLVVSRERQP